MNLKNFEKKRILILGFGIEGIDSFKFLRNLFPDKIIGVSDKSELKQFSEEVKKILESEEKIELYIGKDYLQKLTEYDVILKSPGIPLSLEEIRAAKEGGVTITSQAEIFLENCPGKIIGVTGTKGKSTTSSLIYEILKEGNLKSHLVGNIGKPVLSLLSEATEDDIYVYELSSHQLASLRISPGVAIFLNIYPEHLDYYKNFEEYVKAKSNITRFQKSEDYLIFDDQNEIVRKVSKNSKARKIPLNSVKLEHVINIEKISLKGKFNLKNIKAAVATAQILGVSEEIIERVIERFKPLPHRLEFVGEYQGIEFYNDALSTIPQATSGAIDALGEDVQTIILGGFDRNLEFDKLAQKILDSKIENIILFPTTGIKILEAIKDKATQLKIKEMPKSFSVDNMKDAVRVAYENTDCDKICLLSTASPSFSIFKDYKEKGNLFKKYVKEFEYEE